MSERLIVFAEFKELFEAAGMTVSEGEYRQFAIYADFLAEKNAVMNLTAITEPREVAEKHFLDSVLPLRLVDFPQNAELVDVGAGAGFPSIPMKILRPDLRVTMLDSLNKRVMFLWKLCERLGIAAKAVHIRAEDAGRGEMRERFDVATARAVSRLSTLSGYCLPLVRAGGVFVALKGSDCEAELCDAQEAIVSLGGKVEKTIKYNLPNGDGRTVVVVRKVRSTPFGKKKKK